VAVTDVWALFVSGILVAAPVLAQPDTGKAVFGRVCESCHGPEANGQGQGRALVPYKKELSELVAIVRQGVGLMPGIPRADISDAEIEQVHAYLKGLTSRNVSRSGKACR